MTITNDQTDWRGQFIDTWMELAHGAADPLQVADLAIEYLSSSRGEDPVEVAKRAWGGGQGTVH